MWWEHDRRAINVRSQWEPDALSVFGSWLQEWQEDEQIISEKKVYAEAGESEFWDQLGQHSEIFILENKKHHFSNLYF